MNPTSTVSRPRRRVFVPAAMAILYPKVGNVLRVPLRRTAPAGPGGCEQHPERQFIVWFNRMTAARPGFPLQIKSILLITGQPLCPRCHQALATYLSRYHLANKLRLRADGPAVCGCGGRCGCARRRPGNEVRRLAAALLLDDLLAASDLEMEDEGWWEKAKNVGRAAVLAGALVVGPQGAFKPVYDVAKSVASAYDELRKRQQTVDDNTPRNTPRAGQSRELEFGPGAVIQPNIDVFAQYSLQRLLASPDPAARADGRALLTAVRSGQLRGIYKEDEQVPALWAKERGRGWWQLLGTESAIGAAVLLWANPATPTVFLPPLLVFRNGIRSNAARLDAALRVAWRIVGTIAAVKAANPSFTPRQVWMAMTGTFLPAKEPENSSAIFRLRDS